jgi:hypothetical protein
MLIIMPTTDQHLTLTLTANEIGFAPARVWCATPNRQQKNPLRPVPASVSIALWNTADACASFSPSPFAIVVERGQQRALVHVVADGGWHRWNSLRFEADAQQVAAHVDLEGHTPLDKARKHIRLECVPALPGESREALLARGLATGYPAASAPITIPAWWLRPSYCGWGDQVGISLHLEGPGSEARALAYCTQGLYERWLKRLDAARVPAGTVTIDAGWSAGGVWKPWTAQWPDLKGFIRRQHEHGRKVLLWIGTWLHEGLPDEWCFRAGNTRLCCNPENPAYRKFLRRQVQELLSPDGYDADGFKIDQNAWAPRETGAYNAEHGIRIGSVEGDHPHVIPKAKTWGCELLYDLQKQIYDAALSVKPDALVTSSTVHPLFHDTLSMVRLHDTGASRGSVLQPMQARSELAAAALPQHPRDADDWVWGNYGGWLEYTMSSGQEIGVPCLFYAEFYVQRFDKTPTADIVKMNDLRAIGRAWRKYVNNLSNR